MGSHLTLAQKEEIIQYKEEFKSATHADLKFHFDRKFKVSIGLRTIGGILSSKDKILNDSANAFDGVKKIVKPANPDLEKALELWCDNQELINNPISEAMIKSQAEIFAKNLNIENFKLSNGTLSRFKKRMGIKCRNVQGEMGDTNIDDYSTYIENLRKILNTYNPSDIYNMDETGLYYRSVPIRTNSKNPIRGCKKLLHRVTLLLVVSLTGEKLKPEDLGTAKSTR